METSFDEGAVQLQGLMTAVESYYEDIFEGTDLDLQVQFYYDNLAAGKLAQHSQLSNIEGHPFQCKIRFAAGRSDWFIDSTPLDNSEFDMKQTIAGDLSSSALAYRFDGDVPDTLETLYRGSAVSVPSYTFDMWTVALHEMGHALGITAGTALDDVGDGDYDFDANLVWGHTMAANYYSAADPYHLTSEALMAPYVYPGVRKLPAMIDIFSMVDTGEWHTDPIDLAREGFYSTSATADYHTSGNWATNQVPDATDGVYIRHGGTVTLSAGSAATSLLVAGSSTFDLTANSYVVGGETRIGYYTPAVGEESEIVDPGTMAIGSGQLDTETLIVDHGSFVSLDGGTLSLVSGTVEPSATISGSGVIEIKDDPLLAEGLQINGTLRATGGDLTLQVTPTAASITLDSEATVDFCLAAADSGHLTIDGDVDLGGATLELHLLDAFTPTVGAQLDLIDWNGTIQGTFGEFVAPARCTFDLGNLYVDGTITVLTSAPPLPGDANDDGQVDASDATILAGNWQANNATWEMGDFNDDGNINASDATILAGNWQAGTNSTAVPEPSSMALLLFGLIGLSVFRMRGRVK
ncbi:MAG: dockerin type I domain-containing protein [Planctomycetia bacterium]